MGSIRRVVAAGLLAAVMAAGLGSVGLEAKKPGGGGSGNEAICAYLKLIIEYPYTSPLVRTYALSLWNLYKCQ